MKAPRYEEIYLGTIGLIDPLIPVFLEAPQKNNIKKLLEQEKRLKEDTTISEKKREALLYKNTVLLAQQCIADREKMMPLYHLSSKEWVNLTNGQIVDEQKYYIRSLIPLSYYYKEEEVFFKKKEDGFILTSSLYEPMSAYATYANQRLASDNIIQTVYTLK